MVSGGVDSSVCAALLHAALAREQVVALHVDNGFMRLAVDAHANAKEHEQRVSETYSVKMALRRLKLRSPAAAAAAATDENLQEAGLHLKGKRRCIARSHQIRSAIKQSGDRTQYADDSCRDRTRQK